MPPIALQIIQLITLVSGASPHIAKVYENARNLISMMAGGGLITIKQQEELRAWADAHEAAVLNGVTAPEWQIEPDPE